MLKIYLLSIVYCFILFNNLYLTYTYFNLHILTWNDQADIYVDYLDLLLKILLKNFLQEIYKKLCNRYFVIFGFYIALVKVKNIFYPLILEIQLLKDILQNFSKCIKKLRSSFLYPITFIAIMYSDFKKCMLSFQQKYPS